METNQVSISKNAEIRTIAKNGELWFIAEDVCDVFDISNPSRTLKRLDDDEKGIILKYTPDGKQNMLIISLSALYSLVSLSRKPEVKNFKKWVKFIF